MSERHDDKSGEGRQVPPHRSGGSGRPPQEPSSEKVLRDLFERECQDGDKLAEALGVPRTEAGFLNVPKMLAKIRALPSATRCTACGAKEGEPCRGNCERAMPSSTLEISDEEIVRAIRDAGASDSQWRELTREIGPYSITEPRPFTRALAKRLANHSASGALGERLADIRERAVAKGMRTLSIEEIDALLGRVDSSAEDANG
jgi:transposase